MSNSAPAPAGKKNNSGYFIANDRANDRQPHFRGKLDVEGKEFLVSIWEDAPRDGKAFYSIKLTDPATLAQRNGPAGGGNRPPQNNAPSSSSKSPAAPRPASPPPPPGEDKAFDDIFGSDNGQW